MRRIHSTIAGTLLALSVAACATEPMTGESTYMGEQEVREGTIVRIDPVELDGDHQLGLGAVIGAAAGGLVGHQFGQGHGNDVMTVLGVLAGGYAGQQVQNKYVDKRPGQHVVVQLSNGVHVAVTQPADPALRVGDRVRIEGGGQNARVLRR